MYIVLSTKITANTKKHLPVLHFAQPAAMPDAQGAVVHHRAVLAGLQGPELRAGGTGNGYKSWLWGTGTTVRTRLLANTDCTPILADLKLSRLMRKNFKTQRA